jgi:hypothetical protein
VWDHCEGKAFAVQWAAADKIGDMTSKNIIIIGEFEDSEGSAVFSIEIAQGLLKIAGWREERA